MLPNTICTTFTAVPSRPGDFFHATVGHRFLGHPRSEHRANRAPQLFLRIFRKILACLLLKYFLYSPTSSRQPSRELACRPLPYSEPSSAQLLFQFFFRQSNHHRRVHLHETADRHRRQSAHSRCCSRGLHRTANSSPGSESSPSFRAWSAPSRSARSRAADPSRRPISCPSFSPSARGCRSPALPIP